MLDTAPSFGNSMGGPPTLSKRVATQRPPARRVASGKAPNPFQRFGFDGAKPMGNMAKPGNMSMGYNPAGMSAGVTTGGATSNYAGGGFNPGPSRTQAPGLMGTPQGGAPGMDPMMGGGMIADNAPAMPPPPMMNKSGGMGAPGIMAPQNGGFNSPGGGMMPEGGPTEMGGIFGRYPRQMDPRFRY